MRDLGPHLETDRLLDALGSCRDLLDDHDAVSALLAAWAREIDPAQGPSLEVVGARASGRRGRRGRRLALGTLLAALTMSGMSIAAALTGAQMPVLTPMGAAVVGVVPGGTHLLAPADDQPSALPDGHGTTGSPGAVRDTAVQGPGLSAVGGADLGTVPLDPATPDRDERPRADDSEESAAAELTVPVGQNRPNPPPVRPGPPADRPHPPPPAGPVPDPPAEPDAAPPVPVPPYTAP